MNDLDLKREIRKLAIAYGKPEHPEEETVGLWRNVLDGISDRAVSAAVLQYVRSPARFFPRAGQIADIAREIESSTFGDMRRSEKPPDWNQHQEGPCPVCGAVLQLAQDPHDGGEVWDARRGKWRRRTDDDPEPPRRYRILHDGWAHKERGVPAVGDVVWPARSAQRALLGERR